MATSTLSRMSFWLATGLAGPFFLGCGWIGLAEDQAIGRPCALQASTGPSQGTYRSDAEECPSNLCLKPVVEPGAAGPMNTGPTCSGECSRDSDCRGEVRDPTNPADYRCAKGFTCAIPFVKGPLCCKKLCVCKDFVGPQGLPTPIACQGEGAATCSGTAGAPPVTSAGVEEQTNVYVDVAPTRQLDLVTMIDNSPAMAPKIEKLNAAFPQLIAALRDPIDGALPDLRVAIIDSDLGTGGVYASGPCGPKTLADGTIASFGDQGRFQMPSFPTACPVSPGALFLEQRAGAAVSYAGDISDVFACLTGNLGTGGCFEEHQLQAFEFALAAQGVGNDAQQAAFLRPSAALGLLFLTDEDDCSAAPNDGMFGDKPELRAESPSLRCATRAHQCGGRKLTEPLPGYPAAGPFVHAFSDCRARTDVCVNREGSWQYVDTSGPTDCSPLRSIGDMADEILRLKGDLYQILVAGIFGWPRSDADLAAAEYKIAAVPNPDVADPAQPTVFDYWPVCYDPNHLPSPATTDPVTGFDATAAAWGATGGLRESAYIDAFGASGMRFSICEPDFAPAMASIGGALAHRLQSACFDQKLVDVDLGSPGIQADCRVVWRKAEPDPRNPTMVIYVESPEAMPQCAPGATNGNVPEDCWQLTSDMNQCPASGRRVSVLRTATEVAAEPQLPLGTKLGMQCRTCPVLPPGSAIAPGCDY
jgi:hypothetical protein